jgi:thioredoxin reductase (NADPH)
MAKPAILAVDDDDVVLRAVERDLRRQYGGQYRILGARSGAEALQTLQALKLRHDPVALLLVDQRMPQMTGVEFLEQAIQLFPDAKRVLLTAYADTDAAIRAINIVKLDHYLLKPWDPPEVNLYPVLNDLLDDWLAAYRPPFEGIRVIGLRYSAHTHEVRDFLARNLIPFQWMDVESDPEARRLAEIAGGDRPQLPLVLFPDGASLAQPSKAQLAEKIGLQVRAGQPFYDLIIVGGGPAGLAAAVYSASEGLRTLMIERAAPGGQAGGSSRIENYLGFPVGLSGADLARRAVAQARRFGVEILTPQEATALRAADPYRFVTLADGSELSCHALIVATGVHYRKLEVPDIDRLTGAGVYYGASAAEALSYRGQDVFLVGGANSAGQAAIHFAQYCTSVTLLVRGDSLEKSMSQYLIDQIRATENIRVRLDTSVIAVHGQQRLESITVRNSHSGEEEALPAMALFLFIGAVPQTGWVAGVLERDEHGFLLTGPDLPGDSGRPRGWMLDRDPYLLETNVPGVFVAGDVRYGSTKRIATAVGEGAIAVRFVHEYLSSIPIRAGAASA